ncbi:hypothetical protein [Acaryochloris sp. CCMEE 5410]|uniref:hypothetical protein n=1 Tax=Acaryochloris sp. CCMEE 5410 TaxID=310037 RepID=UPI0002484934|nr:hypothetical protein [Acaryochloris sp. CCMEE 5410]KAI9129004.1 hypothetical protein ON05_037195 [Acaryochloris sp. CCMEE 5410]
MKKPSHMNRNIYPALFVAWCQTLDREAVHRAILESTTQMEFHSDGPADGSDGCADDKTTEGFR